MGLLTRKPERRVVKTPKNRICLLRSGRYSNEEQLRQTLTYLFSERKRIDTLFLLLENKGLIVDWLVENDFGYEVYEKRKGENDANRNFRLLNDSNAVVAFIPRKSTGDKHWDYIDALVEIKAHPLYLVYDEHGKTWDRKMKKKITPYAQD
jgi:hypothetical protein